MSMQPLFEQINTRLTALEARKREQKRLRELLVTLGEQLVEAESVLEETAVKVRRKQFQIEKLEAILSGESQINWLEGDETDELLQHELELVELQYEQDKVEVHIEYLRRRRAEIEEALVESADLDHDLLTIRQQQIDLLAQLDIPDIEQVREINDEIALLQAHLLELDEAVVVAGKCQRALDRLLRQVYVVHRAPNDYRLGWEIDKVRRLADDVRPKLSWFQRELWDVGHEFSAEPSVILQTVYRENHPSLTSGAQPAPRIDPYAIEQLRHRVQDKVSQLKNDFESTEQSIISMNAERTQFLLDHWESDLVQSATTPRNEADA